MESLSLYLQDYKDLVGTLAGVVTIGQFLSGGLICKDIYNKQSTQDVSANPFVGGIAIGVLMLKYSSILNDNAMLVVNVAAIVLNILYTLLYWFYTQNKDEFYRLMGKAAVFTFVLLGYAHWESPEHIEYRFGLIVTCLMLLLIASPLLEVRNVIQKQDSSVLPLPIILSGTVVSFLWLLYGVILMNEFMVFQNVVGFVLCAVQLALCVVYPPKPKTE